MTRRIAKAGWWLLLCGVACGGNTIESKHETVAATAGASATAGTSSTPATSNQSGTGPAEPLFCDGAQPTCLQNCESFERVPSECVDQQFRCPQGSVDFDSCSKDACARRERNCCAATGDITFPDCTADGFIANCPAGYEQKASCLPEGLGIQACTDLKTGEACASDKLVCHTSKCGYNCRCQPDPSGVLVWQCGALPC